MRESIPHEDLLTIHYLETLSARASEQSGRVRDLLDAKVLALAGEHQARLDKLRKDNDQVMAARQPVPQSEALKRLVLQMARQVPADVSALPPGRSEAPTELKSIQYFRDTWSKLSAHKQVNQALNQAPKNAGPLNSHVVALRALSAMRDISPDYLHRFMAHMDTLLRLDQIGTEKKSAPIRSRAR